MKRFVALVLLAALPACVAAGEPARLNASTQPHVLRFASAEEIAGLNPDLNSQLVVHNISELTMAFLVRFDRHNRAVPELATVVPSRANGGVSEDGRTITYHLRRNVRWSDGAPFNGDDVRFSFDAIDNPANDIYTRDGFDRITKIDEPNKETIVIHMREAYAPFVVTFFASRGYALLPKHILGALHDINSAPYNSLPVGIGPFRFTAWHRGESVDMEANPYYWRGLPKLHKIVYEIVPDRNTVMTQLQTGELDLAYPFTGSYLPRLTPLRNVALLRQPAYSYDLLALNMTHPVPADRVVREALRLATDRAAIRDKIEHGVGVLQEAPMPSIYPGIARLPLVPFDIARANALLDRAGWKRAADGVRVKNGTRLALDFASSTGTPDVDESLELIRAGWQQLGVAITIKRYPSSVLFAPYADGGILYTGKFDVLALGFSVLAVDGLQTYRCDQMPPTGQNFSHYCNRDVDADLRDFDRQFTREDQARDLNRALAQIDRDVPVIVFGGREDLFAYNRDLKHFHPNAVSVFDDMMDVDI